jgi:ribosome-associated protein
LVEPKALAGLAAAAAEDVKALDVLVLDLQGISTVTDYFLICAGRSSVQTQAIAKHIEEKLASAGYRYLRREGFREARWILLDYGSLVVHVFQAPEREFYSLERLWGDAKVVAF